jgi:hypothetical protein
MDRRNLYSLIAVAMFSLTSANADTLLIDGVSRSSATVSARPNRGLDMKAVESTWGAPDSKQSPVGEPPIARWEYSDFVVYFEYTHVIHSVAK